MVRRLPRGRTTKAIDVEWLPKAPKVEPGSDPDPPTIARDVLRLLVFARAS